MFYSTQLRFWVAWNINPFVVVVDEVLVDAQTFGAAVLPLGDETSAARAERALALRAA